MDAESLKDGGSLEQGEDGTWTGDWPDWIGQWGAGGSPESEQA